MNLKQYLSKRKMSISEMARLLGVSKQYMSLIIKGKKFPSIHLSRDIESITNGEITAYELLNEVPLRPRCPTCGHVLSRGTIERIKQESLEKQESGEKNPSETDH